VKRVCLFMSILCLILIMALPFATPVAYQSGDSQAGIHTAATPVAAASVLYAPISSPGWAGENFTLASNPFYSSDQFLPTHLQGSPLEESAMVQQSPVIASRTATDYPYSTPASKALAMALLSISLVMVFRQTVYQFTTNARRSITTVFTRVRGALALGDQLLTAQ
jgi:hypothetical protein